MSRVRDCRGRFMSLDLCEAVHEAGHTVTALALNIRVLYVTLEDERGDGGGGCCLVSMPVWLGRYLNYYEEPQEQLDPKRRALIERYIVQGRGGFVAERLLAGCDPYDPWRDSRRLHSDPNHALVCAKLLGIPRGSMRARIEALDWNAQLILHRHWADVNRLANHLTAAWDHWNWSRRAASARISGANCAALCPDVIGTQGQQGRRGRYSEGQSVTARYEAPCST